MHPHFVRHEKIYTKHYRTGAVRHHLLCPGTDCGRHKRQRSCTDQKELRKQKVARRNLHYNILGGPSYTPDFGAVLGGSALMTFRMNPSDTTQLRSVVPMAIAFMFNGGINLFSKPQLFFKGDRFRIFGKFSYKNTEENFYGIGYNTNKDYVRSDSTSKYRYSGVQINPWFLFRLGNSNIFAGPQIDINYDHLTEPGKFLVDEPRTKRQAVRSMAITTSTPASVSC